MKRVLTVGIVAVVLLAAQGGWAGERTKSLQQRLDAVGFRPGPIDGIYGPKTRAAVRAFQVASELPASGSLDAQTMSKLDETCSVIAAVEKQVTAAPVSPIIEVEADDARVDEMLSAAEVEVRRVRLMAVEVLGEHKTTRSRAALGIILYGNTIPEVRVAAAKKLGAFGDAPSVYTLALALEAETHDSVRTAIAEEIERNLPVEPLTQSAMLSGGWQGELRNLTPPPPPPSPWKEIEEPAPAPVVVAKAAKAPCEGIHENGICLREDEISGSWLISSVAAPDLDGAMGVLAPVEAVWGTTPKLQPVAAATSRRTLVRGELATTDDPMTVRGRARLGAYVVNVNGEPARLDAQGYFQYQLNGEPRGPIELVVQEIDVEGRTTERVVQLDVAPTTIARR